MVPAPKWKPKSAYIRFQAEQPNQTWQSDFTHVRLPDGTDAEVITWLDDHSRLALHISAHPKITGPIVLSTFRACVTQYGCPASTLTDNGMVYTVRLAAQHVRGGRNLLETGFGHPGSDPEELPPNHPTTCGKVERFQQTMKTWLTRQAEQAATLGRATSLLDRFRHEYNTQRPHRSLHRRTPAAAYTARPEATPGEPTDRTHARIRHDKINNGKITLRHAGTLYSIGLGRHLERPTRHRPGPRPGHHHPGRHHRRTPARLTLDPTRKYQPQQTTRPEP